MIDYVLCDDLPTMVWLANLADLELHPSLALAQDPDSPTVMAFDLDPGAPAALGECCEVALILRETLDHLGLESAHVAGVSMGGMIVQSMAAVAPTRVRSMASPEWVLPSLSAATLTMPMSTPRKSLTSIVGSSGTLIVA